MRLYKFYSAKWGRDALSKQRLKITTGNDINDPFELTAVELGKPTLRRALNKWRKEMFVNIGLISFCEHWSNPVIWSHYAEAHRGICLGCDVQDDHLVEVDYVDERIEFSEGALGQLSPEPQRLGARLFRTKFSHWRYESEQRVFYRLSESAVMAENGMYFVPFGGVVKLREVILGALYEATGDNLIADFLTSGKVRIRTARPAFKTFRIVEQQKSSLRKTI